MFSSYSIPPPHSSSFFSSSQSSFSPYVSSCVRLRSYCFHSLCLSCYSPLVVVRNSTTAGVASCNPNSLFTVVRLCLTESLHVLRISACCHSHAVWLTMRLQISLIENETRSFRCYPSFQYTSESCRSLCLLTSAGTNSEIYTLVSSLLFHTIFSISTSGRGVLGV